MLLSVRHYTLFVIGPLTLLLSTALSSFSQLHLEYMNNSYPKTGIILSGLPINSMIEVGVSHLLIDKPCNRDMSKDFRPNCSFPRRMELDVSIGINKVKFYNSQAVQLYYTPFAFQNKNSKKNPGIYYTIGHTIIGLGVLHVSNFEELHATTPSVSLGWISPRRLQLIKLNGHRCIQMNFKLCYRYLLNNNVDVFQVSDQDIQLTGTFFLTKKN